MGKSARFWGPSYVNFEIFVVLSEIDGGFFVLKPLSLKSKTLLNDFGGFSIQQTNKNIRSYLKFSLGC